MVEIRALSPLMSTHPSFLPLRTSCIWEILANPCTTQKLFGKIYDRIKILDIDLMYIWNPHIWKYSWSNSKGHEKIRDIDSCQQNPATKILLDRGKI